MLGELEDADDMSGPNSDDLEQVVAKLTGSINFVNRHN